MRSTRRRWRARPGSGSSRSGSRSPNVQMTTVELVAEGERVVARCRCSGTHLGPWRGQEPTGKRMHDIDEVYFLTVHDGRITEAWGLEDTAKRVRQLGL
jgi:predicted ester cyclase